MATSWPCCMRMPVALNGQEQCSKLSEASSEGSNISNNLWQSFLFEKLAPVALRMTHAFVNGLP